jgi:uncharacterized SAM-binding protein YcdF (DUF218 family)
MVKTIKLSSLITKETFWKRFASGILLGWLAALGLGALNLDVFLCRIPHWDLLIIVLGGIVGVTRARVALWIADGLLLAAFSIVAYTPLARAMLRDLEEKDSLQTADALVVLASAHLNSNTISGSSQDRLFHGLELLKAGYAPRLVLTRPEGEAAVWPALVCEKMKRLGVIYSIDEVGPVRDTHDEALAVTRLAEKKCWHRVILVTHSWHMQRAAALFRKAGLEVYCSSCSDGTCNFENPDSPDDRLRVCRYWLHETVGYWVSKWKGWL